MFLDHDQEKRFVELPCHQTIHKSLRQDKVLGNALSGTGLELPTFRFKSSTQASLPKQVAVVERKDSTMHWRNHYPLNSSLTVLLVALIQWILIFPLKSAI